MGNLGLMVEWIGQWSQLSYALLACVIVSYIVLHAGESSERPVDYSVPTPEQCKPGWEGEELDEPSIEVRCPSIPHSRFS